MKLISVIKKVTRGPGHAGMSASERLKQALGIRVGFALECPVIIPRGYLAAF